MVWGDESDDHSARFRVDTLPPSQVRDPRDSRLLGVGASAPEAAAVGEGSGRVETSDSSGKAAWRRRLSPRHRRAVGTFFDRD